jgi:double zinc ribbon protein
MPIALFGIDNDALNLTVNLLVLFLVVVWLALIAWTYFDARRRMDDQILIGCSVGASLFPFVGTMVYSILRPPEFIEDRRERELEIRAAELRVRQLSEQSCPKCEYPIEKGFLRCPNCHARVKDPCPSCGEPIDPRWSMCPYCETPIRREPPARRRPERRPGRQPDRQRVARGAERERPPRAKAPAETRGSAPAKQRPAPKRDKRAPAEPERRKASSPAGRRAAGPRGAKPASDEGPAGGDGDGAGEGRSRPATAS